MKKSYHWKDKRRINQTYEKKPGVKAWFFLDYCGSESYTTR